MRPLIGISTYREQARWGTWDEEAILLPANYADAVASVGGEPVLLPTGAISAEVVARLDALVFSGGADLEPGRYGAAVHPTVTLHLPREDFLGLVQDHPAILSGLYLCAVERDEETSSVLAGSTVALAEDYDLV